MPRVEQADLQVGQEQDDLHSVQNRLRCWLRLPSQLLWLAAAHPPSVPLQRSLEGDRLWDKQGKEVALLPLPLIFSHSAKFWFWNLFFKDWGFFFIQG
jgi:hypothetical protein